ncbi:MAG TPA: flagellar biosynthesis protein FliO [Xanthobacteraceae bacterium]|nr:flagellar biosynthesis protein FliO [Xanthobacteraceae bacterium]
MFDLFGAEMPLAVRFFLAFLIVLGLIGAAAWAVRRFGSSRIGGTARGRLPRLAIIDYASVDARRRLILVRRDNVEHLVMIGGPTDVVVESNIVRAVAATRDIPAARPPAGSEILPRAIALPEAGNGSWPLQPEPLAPFPPPRRGRVESIPDEVAPTPAPSFEIPRPQREALTAIAEDIAAMPTFPPRSRPSRPAEPRPAATSPHTETVSAADQSLAEMAQRLEAALRKPKTPDKPAELHEAATADEPAAKTDVPVTPPAPPPRPARPADAKPARVETKAKEGKLYDTLEQEMASLLGRPPGKTG